MTEQPGTSRRSVAFAALFLVLAVVSFGASYYLLDGARYAQPLIEQVAAAISQLTSPAAPTPSPAQPAPAKLVLPAGMPQKFALRLWQEQVDSQPMIERLVTGEVRSLRIDKVDKKADEARLYVTVALTDGSTAPGVIGLRRFGRNWYIAYAVARSRAGDDPGPGTAKLPKLDQIDTQLLQTMLVEQTKSQSVIAEYLAGIVTEVVIDEVRPGPQTVTMDVEMLETHGDGYARLVAIKGDESHANKWFLARFTKTGDATKTAQ